MAYIALTHKHAQMYQVTIKANANIKSRKFTKLRSKNQQISIDNLEQTERTTASEVKHNDLSF